MKNEDHINVMNISKHTIHKVLRKIRTLIPQIIVAMVLKLVPGFFCANLGQTHVPAHYVPSGQLGAPMCKLV